MRLAKNSYRVLLNNRRLVVRKKITSSDHELRCNLEPAADSTVDRSASWFCLPLLPQISADYVQEKPQDDLP